MKSLLKDLKESTFLKLYLILFPLISIAYFYLAVIREEYIKLHSLGENITAIHYEYLTNLTTASRSLEYLFIFIGITFLIKIIFIKDKIDLKQFFLINFPLFVIYGFAGYIVSMVTETPIGNLMGLLLVFTGIILISIIFSVLKLLHGRKTITT